MSSIFHKEKAPDIIVPPMTQQTTPEAKEAEKGESQSIRKRRGWRAAMATGPLGVTGEATTSKSLLGQ